MGELAIEAVGDRRQRLHAMAAWLAAAGILSALAFALNSSRDSTDDLLFEYSVFANAVIFFAFLVLLAYGIGRLYSNQPFSTFGFERVDRSVLWPIIGVVVLAIIVGAALEPFLHAGDDQGLTPDAWDSSRAMPFFLNATMVVVIGPFAEETFFRGLGVRVLGYLGAPAAIIGTAVFFGLAHGLLVALPTLVVFGIALAWLRIRYRSILPAMIAHGSYNAIGLALAFLV